MIINSTIRYWRRQTIPTTCAGTDDRPTGDLGASSEQDGHLPPGHHQIARKERRQRGLHRQAGARGTRDAHEEARPGNGSKRGGPGAVRHHPGT